METGFYVLYLIFALTAGLILLIRAGKSRAHRLFGAAILLLGFGDAFHLVPRAVGLFTDTLNEPSADLAMWLGLGKFITSVTMTLFYLFLYVFMYKRTETNGPRFWDYTVSLLIILRIFLCAFPQNNWITNDSPLLWNILRNIPFVILGVVMVILTHQILRHIRSFKWLWIMIILSFAFYIPVLLFADRIPWVGMLMIPKTVCYMIIALMALSDLRKVRETERETTAETNNGQTL
ncbi:MAG: hypothetical protein J6023_03650 [Clostridia bacterium]|nr:hypothetical protein [Clostridia bacterium]